MSPNPRTRMLAIALAAVLVLGAIAAIAFITLREEKASGHTDRITLAAPATDGPPQTTEGELITHLALEGGQPGKTTLALSLTDMVGRDLPPDAPYGVTVDLTNLNDGTSVRAMAMTRVEEDARTPSFELQSPGMETEGWWRIRASIERPDGGPLGSEFYVLLPDPNLTGFDTPPAPPTDPAAGETLSTAIRQMSEWDSLRWWEWLSGGNDSLIMADFAVTTTGANGQPDSFRNDMRFAGGFERRTDGAPPVPPARDHYTAVTIGDRAWSRNDQGEVTEMSPIRYLPINRYPETYQGATSIRTGIQEEIDGREAQIVTFHVPTLATQSEAWYAFWIDTGTGDIIQLAMIANNHYMLWICSDINEPFVIEPPEGVDLAPTTPVASPSVGTTMLPTHSPRATAHQ